MDERGLCAGAGTAVLRYPESFFPQEGMYGERGHIHARALLLEDRERLLIISLELPSIRPTELLEELRDRMAEYSGIEKKNVWICMTHNMSSFHVPNREQFPEKYQIHMSTVWNGMTEAFEQARRAVCPVRVGIGTDYVDVNANRDIQTNHGWWTGIDRSALSDKTLTVIRLENREGVPVAVLIHYALKCETLDGAQMAEGERKSTPEISGIACQHVEQELQAPAFYFMGAAADQVPRKKARYCRTDAEGNMEISDVGAQGYAIIDALGLELGQAAVKLASQTVCTEEQAKMQVEHHCRMLPGQEFYNGGKPYHPTPEYVYRPSHEEELRVELLFLGKAVLIGLQPETTASIGIRLREALPGCIPLVIAMVNGGKDYLSDTLAYDRFAFGGTHSVFARGGAERFLEWITEYLTSSESALEGALQDECAGSGTPG